MNEDAIEVDNIIDEMFHQVDTRSNCYSGEYISKAKDDLCSLLMKKDKQIKEAEDYSEAYWRCIENAQAELDDKAKIENIINDLLLKFDEDTWAGNQIKAMRIRKYMLGEEE